MPEPGIVIVVVEDDPQIRRFLRTALGAHGFEIHEADNGRQGLTLAETRKPDVVILDLGLPDIDGIEVVKRLRTWTLRPILILSARDREADKVAALDAGADDYLTKPFGIDELMARIRVALRHASRPQTAESDERFTMGSVTIDLGRRQVFRDGDEVHLTPIEFRLLALLVRHAGKVLTHRHLLREVWGPAHVEHPEYLRVHMGALRQKLEPDPARPQFLRTETGVGYRLTQSDL
jgi:two-component system KDP operon response regulator KdpE